MRYSLLYLILMVCCISVSGQDQPIITCVSILEDGTVRIEWTEPTPIANEGYNVWRVDPSGDINVGYALPATTSLEYIEPLIESMPIDYYVVRDGYDGSDALDTASTMFLEFSATIDPSFAGLEWSLPFDPMPNSGEFIIERERENFGMQVIVDGLPTYTTSYEDTLYGACFDLIPFTYRVRYESSQCQSSSDTISDKFRDLRAPPQAQVETISVDPLSESVTINWAPSPSRDIEYYVIQEVSSDDSLFSNLDSVLHPTVEYIYDPQGLEGPYKRTVIAKDTCKNEISYDTIHSTIQLEAIYPPCGEVVNLDWTPYRGWIDGISHYDIKAFIEFSPNPTIIEAGLDPSTTSFDFLAQRNTNYRFFIEAFPENESFSSSTSNGVSILTEYPDRISDFYLSSVSTKENEDIEVILHTPNAPDSTRFELFRAEGSDGFKLVYSIDPPPDTDTIRFVDTDARSNQFVYTYYWDAYDGCNALVGSSNESSSILLNIRTPENNLENQLFWNDYIGWEQGVSSYQILRAEGDDKLFPFDGTPDGVTDWLEDVEDLLFTSGKFCYQVEAVETESSFGGQNVSTSNVSCVTREPLIWIPDAMVYGGFNDVFAPVMSFVDFETYRMEIYNKWGELLFESREIENGWDGTYKGSAVREDFYRYIISVEDGEGKAFIEEGRLYMVRSSN